jgi:hypothetical protein
MADVLYLCWLFSNNAAFYEFLGPTERKFKMVLKHFIFMESKKQIQVLMVFFVSVRNPQLYLTMINSSARIMNFICVTQYPTLWLEKQTYSEICIGYSFLNNLFSFMRKKRNFYISVTAYKMLGLAGTN